MPAENLPSPTLVADMCAQHAWRVADDESTRKHLEMAADTIRALMARCVALARSGENVGMAAAVADIGQALSAVESIDQTLSTVAWEYTFLEGDVQAGEVSALAEVNRDDQAAAGADDEFRSLTVPYVTWFGNDRDAVEVRAFAGWLTQMADWLEGMR